MDKELVEKIILAAFEEDFGDCGDITTFATINCSNISTANIIAKSNLVITGLCIVEQIFEVFIKEHMCDSESASIQNSLPEITFNVNDGDKLCPGTIIGTIKGETHIILHCERTILNILQKMSAIATQTSHFVDLIKPYNAKLLDTRKTSPGLRVLEKYAVLIGGGTNHRFGLYDQYMIKDNHIKACESDLSVVIAKLNNYKTLRSCTKNVVLEVSSLEQVMYIFEHNLNQFINRLLLDNMVKRSESGVIDVSYLVDVVKYIDGRIDTEASGNVDEHTINIIASTGVTHISCGKLTHSVDVSKYGDISLKIIN